MGSMFNKNLFPKILAVSLAFVLWIYVTIEQSPSVETTLTVPLEVRNVTTPLVAVDVPETAKVKLRGSRSVIAGLSTQDVKCYVDVRGLTEGRHSAKVVAQMPPGLELLEVSPDKIQFKLDAAVNKKLPAQVKLIGTAASGTAVAKVSVSPEQVTVEGPRDIVDSVDKVIVPVDLNGKNSDFAVAVAPVLQDKGGGAVEGLIVYPDKINVNANLVKGLSQKTVEIKPLVYGELAVGAELKSVLVKPVKIEVSGEEKALEKLEAVYTEPVNIAGLTQNTVKEAKLQLPEGVVASQNTVVVQIGVEIKR